VKITSLNSHSVGIRSGTKYGGPSKWPTKSPSDQTGENVNAGYMVKYSLAKRQ
jgi:hypothetical protein